MREEKEPITIFEDMYDSSSRYSKDFKCAYNIPDECGCYRLRDECLYLELQGRESMIDELVLPPSFFAFHVDSIDCLPYLRKIISFSEFDFVTGDKFYSLVHDVSSYWEGTRLEEICVLPWLVDKYKKIFGYWPGLSDPIIKVTAIPDNIALKLTNIQENGLVTSKNGRTLIKVDKHIKVLEIPIEIERIAATTFEKGNAIEKIVIMGDSEDYHKNRNAIFDFDKDAVNSLDKVETLVFQGPMHTNFYDDHLEGSKIPNLKTIIYPLWNYQHFCFRGSEAEHADIYPYEIKAENFSSVELVEEDGIIYSKDGKFLVSGVDCKSKIVRIKDGVEEIFQYAFCCNRDIEEVYIPSTVTNVGHCAFKSCKNIKQIVFNFNQVTKDSEGAFFTYSHNIDFYFPDSHLSNVIKHQYEKLHSHFSGMGLGELSERYVKDDSVNVNVYTLPDYMGEVSVDEESGMVYDENGETFVGVLKERAKDIIELSLPNHVKNVYLSAFSNMSLLEKIVAPKGIDITRLYKLAASDCPRLKTIIAGDSQIVIENNIVYTNSYKVIIAVSKHANITSFVCRDGVEIIEASAFEGHKELKSVQLPQTIKIISNKAFASTGITEIIIPASVKRMGDEVFKSCTLSMVVFEGQTPEGSNAFNGVSFMSSSVITVPKEYKSSYKEKYPSIKNLIKTPLPKWLSW